ncbi:MAG: hypothetical protein FWC70_13000 [Defluviitaleaceae bacterium]|nr:hypothetical protein [Defluviitaleaceae bacterium]
MKKYNMLYSPLVERILAEEGSGKDSLKAAKTRLHRMFGAYLSGNAHKKAARILEESRDVAREIDESVRLLALHASTRERFFRCAGFRSDSEGTYKNRANSTDVPCVISCVKNFYEFIAANVSGEIKAIADLGCGFNPFALPLMPEVLTRNLEVYHAFDIDLRTRDMLNIFFESRGLPAAAKCADLAVETPGESADVAFMFKLLPVLEAQIPGRGFALASALNARFLVVTYPTKSLGGREKGMEKNYAAAFEGAVEAGALGNFELAAKGTVGSELVYVMKRS